MNTSVIAQDRLLYTGAYNGKIYLQDAANTTADASETSPGAISAYWRSGWIDAESMLSMKYIQYFDVNFSTQTDGSFEFGYGFDFNQDRNVFTVDMQAPGAKYDQATYDVDVYGGLSDTTKLLHSKGNGKFFQYLIRHNTATESFKFNGFEIPIKKQQESF